MATKGNSFARFLQGRLAAHGYKLDQDGVAGDETRSALRAFQRRMGLQVTGTATQETVDALRGAPKAPPMPTQRPPMAVNAPAGTPTEGYGRQPIPQAAGTPTGGYEPPMDRTSILPPGFQERRQQMAGIDRQALLAQAQQEMAAPPPPAPADLLAQRGTDFSVADAGTPSPNDALVQALQARAGQGAGPDFSQTAPGPAGSPDFQQRAAEEALRRAIFAKLLSARIGQAPLPMPVP